MKLKTRTNQPVEGDELDNSLKLNGSLEVTGDAKLFENIVDKDGHKRFIEGDINLEEGLTGITKTYGKWSLSGTHLLIVLSCDFANGTALSNTLIAYVNVPNWVKDKIVNLFASVITAKTQTFYNSDFSSQQAQCYLRKTSNGINIYVDSITFSKDRNARFEFDLLIDNE